MRVSVLGAAVLLSAVYSRPLFPRALIDISPNISPDVDLSSSNNCYGIGISACDPINVNGTQNSNNNNNAEDPSSGGSSDDTSSSSVDASSSNDCFGVGISACDPINVDGTQNSNNNNDNSVESSSKETSDDVTDSESGDGASLLDLDLTVAPDVDLSSSNDCFGVGIFGLVDTDLDIDPTIDLSSSNDCVGVGVSVCDPINVNGTQNSNNDNVDTPATSTKETSTSSNEDSSSDALIDVSPDVSPDLDLSSSNDCIGVGISVCDPINVDGTQNSNNNNNDDDESSSETPTSTTEDDSEGGSLINLSPTVSPDLDLSSSNDCFGIGISACDPINVGGTQGSNNNNGK
ncbi:hypothetical protein GGR57DRAFT_456309 [Xylariaceae sp. FL1272]|nr:hypothetical protein GGR57DRAFT_456309 [Xylariaceae sp. FL1272]